MDMVLERMGRVYIGYFKEGELNGRIWFMTSSKILHME